MIMRCIDWLGEGVLKLLRLMFLNKAARRAIDGEPAPAPEPKTEVAEESGEGRTRKALIAEAVSLHRSQQGVLSELDEESRQKLQEIGREDDAEATREELLRTR